MARELSESPSTVAGWKRNDRIPAEKQPHVLAVGLALGLPVTAELVMFPSGDVPETVALAAGGHRPHVIPRTTADTNPVGLAQSGKYGKRAPVLPTSEQTVAA